MISLTNCPICEASDWEDLSHMRDPKYWYERDWIEKDEIVPFKICRSCGFVTYDYVEESRLNDRYNWFRNKVTPNDIITGNRCNQYHMAFLCDQDIKGNVLDIGCGTGQFLDLLTSYSGVVAYGTEVVDGFINYARNEYGLKNVSKEIDESIKYDFISLYHALEHLQHPDKILIKCYDIMSDDGMLYVSVPIYFDELEHSHGGMIHGFEDYYYLNHVNVFSYKSVINILTKIGFEIIKENHSYYGLTLLCRKGTVGKIVKEDYAPIIQIMQSQATAIKLQLQQKYADAANAYPKFPDAYMVQCLQQDTMKDLNKIKAVMDPALKIMPENVKLLLQYAKCLYQWDMNKPDKPNQYTNNVKLAEGMFNTALMLRPGIEDVYFFKALIDHKYKKDNDRAVGNMRKRMAINPMVWAESMNFIAQFWKDA